MSSEVPTRSRPTPMHSGAVCVLVLVSAAPVTAVFGVGFGLRLLLITVLPAAAVAVLGSWLFTGRSAPARWAMLVLAVVTGESTALSLSTADPFSDASLSQRVLVSPGDAWRRVLSVDVPVPSSHTFLDGFALYLVLAVVITAGVAMSSRPILGLVPAFGLFGAGLALGVGGPADPMLLGLLFAAGAAALLATTTRHAGSGLHPVGMIGLATVVLAALTVSAFVPLRDAADPRHDVVHPVDITAQDSPLARLSSLLRRPSASDFVATLEGSNPPAPQDWLLATYDTYTGSSWTSRITTEPVGNNPRVSTRTTVGTRAATALVTLDHTAQLLPHQSDVTDARPEGVRYDAGSDALLAARPTTTYSIGYRVSTPTVDQLSAAAVPDRVAPTLTALPTCVPGSLRKLASQVTAAATLPDEKAIQLEQVFTSAPFVFDPASAPGDGCARIAEFLRTHHGTSEQFATAYALAARSLGLPARVAVGFGPGSRQGSHLVVTNADARAWVQIKFTGVGWTDFEPTPAGKGAFTRPSAKQPALTKIQRSVSTGHLSVPAAAPKHLVQASQRHTALYLLAVILVLVLLLVPTVVRTTRRRLRQRVAGERAGVLNAWRDALLCLRSADVDTDFTTAPQIADAGRAAAGRAEGSLRALSELAEQAVYGEVVPGQASAGWVMARDVRRRVTASLPVRRRLTRAILSFS